MTSCSLTLSHYREMLQHALEAGYRFKAFHEPYNPSQRVIFLRHDIDIALEEALDMATVEEELGVQSTYFLLINSPVYNLLAPDALKMVEALHSKGHWIGLHVDLNLLALSDSTSIEGEIAKLIAFYQRWIPLSPVISFHRPPKEVLGLKFQSIVNTYAPPFFGEMRYVSDSRGVWREGCPCRDLRSVKYQALQILVHPVWWLGNDESLVDRANNLMQDRFHKIKKYLVENVEPFGKLL